MENHEGTRACELSNAEMDKFVAYGELRPDDYGPICERLREMDFRAVAALLFTLIQEKEALRLELNEFTRLWNKTIKDGIEYNHPTMTDEHARDTGYFELTLDGEDVVLLEEHFHGAFGKWE